MPAPAVIQLSSLTGLNGFQINGEATNDLSGSFVASAGDVNGDGFEDVIIGAPDADPNGAYTGASYVVFGRASGFAANLNLSTLDGTNGFRINGEGVVIRSGTTVGTAGDVNGDGFADVIIGASAGNPDGSSGVSYVIFGQAAGFAAELNLPALTGANGFQMNGGTDLAGRSVASAGDLNGDGFADLIIGSRGSGGNVGAGFVVFGKASGFPPNLDLLTLDGASGFRINGEAAGDELGWSAATAGDVNGDGFDDLIIGAVGADPNGSRSGASYVVFGKASGFAASLNLVDLDGTNGFQISGEVADDISGGSVASAGDVNGDGFDDLIIGAWGADPNGSNSGASYVVFGRASGFAANFNLSTLDGTNGFQINGEAARHRSGWSAAAAGDLNGDGFADLIIGANGADPNGSYSGASYVVFGRASGFAASFNLSTLDGTNGFQINGEQTGDDSGWSVASAGDVNGDGFDDLIIGADRADPNGSSSGASYVLFGSAFGATTVFTGTAAAELVIGTAGADTLTGNGGPDVFRGGAGDDRLVLPTVDGYRDIDGGTGLDTLAFSGAGTTLNLATTLPARITSIEVIDLTGTGNNTLVIDRLAALDLTADRVGGIGILRVFGNAGDAVSFADATWVFGGTITEGATTFNRLTNGNAELRVAAGVSAPGVPAGPTEGPDTLSGTPDADTIEGLGGNDSLSGLAGADRLSGGPGNDTLTGGAGNDTVAGGPGNDQLAGGDDLDTLDFSGAAGAIATDLGRTTRQNTVSQGLDLISGFEAVIGSGFNDTLTGSGLDNRLEGGGGNDALNGGAGNDTHIGGEGNDVLRANTGADSFDGGTGIDVVDYRAASSIRVFLDGSGTNAAAAGGDSFAGVENIYGAVGGDVIVGNGDANRLAGFDGNDTLWGRAGTDQLEGGNGNDRLYGGTGNDVLVGGAGNDTFVFADAPAAGGLDRTTDFVAADDQIEIDASAFGGGLVAGAAVQFVAGAAPSSAGFTGGVFLYNTVNGFLGFDADGGGAGAVEWFFRLQNLPVGLSAADFTVVA